MTGKYQANLDATWQRLVPEIRRCSLCTKLPNPPNPVLQGSPRARMILISQAPGNRAHAASQPFVDASGNRLRNWLGLTQGVFYNSARVAIMPMAFCYPGTSGTGDKPPPPICAATWHKRILSLMPRLELTLLIGRAAQVAYLPEVGSMSDIVRRAEACHGDILPLPHPSWHNNAWLARNPWFEERMLPRLRRRISAIMAQP